MITLAGVTVEYPGSKPLEAVNLDIGRGSSAVMGPSGSGKSTLLRLIAGLQEPHCGAITIDGSPVACATWRTASDTRVSMIHQDYRLVPFLTLGENLSLAAELRGVTPTTTETLKALEDVRLDPDLMGRRPGEVSGGEQQRVAIARALLTGASVLVADEPTGALDADNTTIVADLLADLGTAGVLTVVVATHDDVVAGRMQRRLRLAAGGIDDAE